MRAKLESRSDCISLPVIMSVTCTLMHAAVFCKHTPVDIRSHRQDFAAQDRLGAGRKRTSDAHRAAAMGAARSVAEFTKGNNASAFALGAPEQVARSPLRLAFAAAATSKGTT